MMFNAGVSFKLLAKVTPVSAAGTDLNKGSCGPWANAGNAGKANKKG